MNRDQAHALVDRLFDDLENMAKETASAGEDSPIPAKKETPEGLRVVRTKTSGDRVYLLDDNKKTRQWITAPEILDALGFDMGDVKEVEDSEMLKYQMGTPLHKAPDVVPPVA